ncbi:MAG: hypothetical protein K2H46_11310 [Muribaculaceae bacterium]|nr:hypothetical protein [Muribaculaceae bacterium]
MKGDKLTFWLSFTAILFAGVTSGISYISTPENIENTEEVPAFLSFLSKDFYKLIVENSGKIILFSFIVVVIVQIIIYSYNKDVRKDWLEAYLKLIALKHLGGSTSNQRITIFVKRRGWRFIIPYICKSFTHKHWFLKLIDFPNPIKMYLVPYARYSFPDKSHSYTYFRAVKEENDAQSIAARCFATASAVNVNTKYIDNIEIPRKKKKFKKQEKDIVDVYQKDTGMSSYRKIRLLCRKANHIYAVPLMDPDEKPDRRWGVLVFDIISSNSEDDLKNKISDDAIREHQEVINISLLKIT